MPSSYLKLRAKGFSIDAGLAVDARLVRSASSPYTVIKSMQTRKMLPIVYADKGYHGQPHRGVSAHQ